MRSRFPAGRLPLTIPRGQPLVWCYNAEVIRRFGDPEAVQMANDASTPRPGTEERKQPNLLRRIERHIQSRTLAGLIDLVPLLVTIIVLVFIIGYADNFIKSLGFVEDRPWDFPGIGLLVLVVVFYLAGLAMATGFGRKAMEFKDTVLGLIPIVRTIFGVTQQAATVLTSQYNFSRVVFLEWPREGMAALGFVTGRVFAPETSQSLVLVYIPTVPNPTSGNMALVVEDEVMETDLTVQDAMKLVFSGGIVLPKAIALARMPREKRGDQEELIGRYETASDSD